MKDVMSSFDKERMPSGPSSFYAANIMEGLSHLHQYKIGHRDIKPANIMIGSDGYCLLIDLGLGKNNKKYSTWNSHYVISRANVCSEFIFCFQTGKVFDNGVSYTCVGSPLYMAPEFFKSKGITTTCTVILIYVYMFITRKV